MVDRFHQEKALAGLLTLSCLLVASDLVQPTNQFWSGHQIVTGVVTGAIFALVAVAGLDRLMARRDARRWRPLALIVIERIKVRQRRVEDALSSRTLDYCQRRYGRAEVPEGRDYFEVLPEALDDPETWAAPEEGYPSLFEELDDQLEVAWSDFEVWAPIFIADPGLAPIANLVVARYEAERSIRNTLELLLASACLAKDEALANDVRFAIDAPSAFKDRYQRGLIHFLIQYRDSCDQLDKLIASYRDD